MLKPISYLVICLDDDENYTAATHALFSTHAAAVAYAATIALARKALVVTLWRTFREA